MKRKLIRTNCNVCNNLFTKRENTNRKTCCKDCSRKWKIIYMKNYIRNPFVKKRISELRRKRQPIKIRFLLTDEQKKERKRIYDYKRRLLKGDELRRKSLEYYYSHKNRILICQNGNEKEITEQD